MLLYFQQTFFFFLYYSSIFLFKKKMKGLVFSFYYTTRILQPHLLFMGETVRYRVINSSVRSCACHVARIRLNPDLNPRPLMYENLKKSAFYILSLFQYTLLFLSILKKEEDTQEEELLNLFSCRLPQGVVLNKVNNI